VHEAALVRVVEAPRRLDGDVEDPRKRVAVVELSRADRVLEAAAVDALGEDARDAVDGADVVAAHDVGMKAEADPRLGLADEGVLPAGLLEDVGLGALDREVDVPAAVADAVDGAHAADAEEGDDFVEAEDDVAGPPAGGGRRQRGGDERRLGDGELGAAGVAGEALAHGGRGKEVAGAAGARGGNRH
jgi:hypothetical protein